MRPFWLVLLLLMSLATLKSQNKEIAPVDMVELEEIEDSLGVLAYTILNDSLSDNRFLACRAVIPQLVRALKRPNSFYYPFEQLRYFSIQYPADSSFRILTWQLFVERGEYRYYGAIQMNTPELQLYPLIDRSFEISDEELEQAVLPADRWYGCVLYDLQQVDSLEQRQYLLFGADSYSTYHRRKVVDVLTFDPETGKPSFGAPIFVETEDYTGRPVAVKHRLVRQFSAASYATTKFDTQTGLIMVENLVEMGGDNGEGLVMVPDGSYYGYELQADGRWHSINKVYNHTYSEPPREVSSEGGVKRDLFGRRKQ